MPNRIAQVAIDAAQPQVIAEFWCAVLGWVVHDIEDGVVWCIGPADGGWPGIDVGPSPDPKSGKNRLHLDVRVGTGLVGDDRLAALETERERLVNLGAVRVRLLPADGINEATIVMQDVEGNEFCLD